MSTKVVEDEEEEEEKKEEKEEGLGRINNTLLMVPIYFFVQGNFLEVNIKIYNDVSLVNLPLQILLVK